MNLCSLDDWSNEEILALLERAEAPPATDHLAGRIVCTAFFEPSTRTRLSFEAAAHRAGAKVIGFSDAAATSASKGETLEDSIRVLAGYADAIVLRHPQEGAAARAAMASTVPIINAGDGAGQHPTQTLVDLFTIKQECGGIAGITVAVIGDLLYGRTVHSLVPMVQRLGGRVVAVPAKGLGLPAGFDNVETTTLDEAAAMADVLYVTRVQRERFANQGDYEAASGQLIVDADLLSRTQSKAIVLHPLPRLDEVATDVDALPAAKYFDQARNGVPVRMAVLATLLENAK